MKLALDVGYPETGGAKAVALSFADWPDTAPLACYEARLTHVAPYVPGAFYERELPCLLEVLKQVPMDQVELLVIDGFVTLDDQGKPGLGTHLHRQVGGMIPVIGVSKSAFHQHQDPAMVRPLLRGQSQAPLYITAVGLDLGFATQCIASMAGEFRLPLLLKHLDQITKA